MRSTFASLLVAAGSVAAAPAASIPTGGSSGLSSPIISTSSNGSAICVTGNVAVTASTSSNIKLNLPSLDNQTVVTGIFNDMQRAGSTFDTTVNGGETTVSGTYNINVKICYPVSGTSTNSTIQFLTHGVGFDKSYWDFAPGYSYVDSAAVRGYTTFSYDRLGTGASTRPTDANAVVQAPLELSVAHELVQKLRSGSIGGKSYANVVGVGHSFGSAISQGLTNAYPSDLSAVVLTGFSLSSTGFDSFFAALDFSIASQNTARFIGLNNDYLVDNSIVGNQFAFFKAQGFPPANLVAAEATKQTTTLGELLTIGNIIAPATSFAGPVDVVNGDSDWPFCDGNCNYPADLTAEVAPALYPASTRTASYNAYNAGHGLNQHYSAGAAFQQIQNFIKGSGF